MSIRVTSFFFFFFGGTITMNQNLFNQYTTYGHYVSSGVSLL